MKKSYRSGSSLFMLFSLIVLAPSGIALHFLDQSGHETAREVAMALHNVSALVFLISTVIHLTLNRHSIAATVRAQTGPYPVISRKSVVIAIIFAAILAAVVSHIFILG